MYLIHLDFILMHSKMQLQLFNLNHFLNVIFLIFSMHLNLFNFFIYVLPMLKWLQCFNLNVLNQVLLIVGNPLLNIYYSPKIYMYHLNLYIVQILINLMLLTMLQKTFYQNQFQYSFLLVYFNMHPLIFFKIILHFIFLFHNHQFYHPTFFRIYHSIHPNQLLFSLIILLHLTILTQVIQFFQEQVIQ